ncbi:hypothetical protein [Shewanella glacialimarina]|uniref:hypothetical protein n=1 Tax=Shewanella glacialimarina TaxID=2590884 RepID=UPI001CF8FCF4|nr:hypothetical protein [Shewanella glacialimarina]UCX05450.1 hypothetical protein FJ709_13725 [Shewanella glacialimarina]
MEYKLNKFDVISALRLRGMKVLGRKANVVHITNPSNDFKNKAVEIIENIKGIRRRSSAVQFHGVTVRWNEE